MNTNAHENKRPERCFLTLKPLRLKPLFSMEVGRVENPTAWKELDLRNSTAA